MTQLELMKYRTSFQKKCAELMAGDRTRATRAIEPAADEMDRTQGAQARDLALCHAEADSRAGE
jgi:hypothetical protein